MLLVLAVALFFLAILCYYGIKRSHAVWKHVTFKQAIQNMRDTLKGSQGQGFFTRFGKMKEAFDILVFRGEWDQVRVVESLWGCSAQSRSLLHRWLMACDVRWQEDHPEKKDVVHTNFVDRCPALPPHTVVPSRPSAPVTLPGQRAAPPALCVLQTVLTRGLPLAGTDHSSTRIMQVRGAL